MYNSLLYLGLITSAFMFYPHIELREIKMTAAIVFALALSMAEIYKHGIRPCKNIWVLMLLAYLPIHIIFSATPVIILDGIPVSNFWSWLPTLKILIFGLMFTAIAGHDFTRKEIKTILNVMVWCGVITSLYEISQFFFVDQFFLRCADGDWGRVAGFIGNPTLTSIFCAMIVPLALYLKDWPKVVILIIGAVIPDCQMAWISLAAGIMTWVALRNLKCLSLVAIGGLLMSIVFFFLYTHSQHFKNVFADHERFEQWRQIFKDWTGPLDKEKGFLANYSLTGRGLGSFRFVYHIQNANIGHPNMFHQAHNDYLEFGYSAGFVGFGLFIASIFYMFRKSLSGIFEHPLNRALLASVVILLVDALGSFPFQVGTFIFYGVVICGLLHRRRILDEQ